MLQDAKLLTSPETIPVAKTVMSNMLKSPTEVKVSWQPPEDGCLSMITAHENVLI
jgi:hypothetical protein